jgi:hypothetical protein
MQDMNEPDLTRLSATRAGRRKKNSNQPIRAPSGTHVSLNGMSRDGDLERTGRGHGARETSDIGTRTVADSNSNSQPLTDRTMLDYGIHAGHPAGR